MATKLKSIQIAASVILFLFACAEKSIKNTIESLPKLNEKSKNIDDSKTINLTGTELHEKVKAADSSLFELFALGKVELREMDTAKVKNFYLLQLRSNSNMVFAAFDKTTFELIDLQKLDGLDFKIESIYPFSSKELHDGTHISLEKSNPADILNHEIEISESGKIQLNEDTSSSKIFRLKNQNQPFSGSFTSSQSNWEIELEMRDGSMPSSYSYMMAIFSLKRCIQTYSENDLVIKNGKLNVGNFVFIFENNQIKLSNKKYIDQCDQKFEKNTEFLFAKSSEVAGWLD